MDVARNEWTFVEVDGLTLSVPVIMPGLPSFMLALAIDVEANWPAVEQMLCDLTTFGRGEMLVH